jgi:hypothetical protein
MEGLKQDKTEIEKFLGQAERSYVKKLLQSELKKVDAYIVDQETKDVEHEKLQGHSSENEHQKLFSMITKYAWSDEGKNVKVYITSLDGIKDVPTDKIDCKFSKSSFDLTIHGYQGKDLRLCIPTLNKDIDPENSKFTIKSSAISITLRKVKDGKWGSLKEGEDTGAGVGGGMPGAGGMPGMGGAGGMPGMGGAGGMPEGMEGMFGGAGGAGGMPEGMEGMFGGAGGMPGMGGAGGMPEGMEGMFGGAGGAGGMPDFGAMGGEGGMPDMGAMGGAEGGEGGDQNAGLMDMMKKMYDEGDENTRKMMTEAMMKGGADQQPK